MGVSRVGWKKLRGAEVRTGSWNKWWLGCEPQTKRGSSQVNGLPTLTASHSFPLRWSITRAPLEHGGTTGDPACIMPATRHSCTWWPWSTQGPLSNLACANVRLQFYMRPIIPLQTFSSLKSSLDRPRSVRHIISPNFRIPNEPYNLPNS